MDQSEWFNEVLSHKPEGFDPYVESHYKTDEGLNYGSWDQYKGQVDFDERSVLPNEIVIDIDAEDTETARQENTRVLNFLDSNGYDYLLGDTGGTGFHIHLFFKYKGLEVEEHREVRIALYKYLKAKCREEVDAETSLWDDQPVMFDVSSSKGHLVRAFGGRKTGSECRKTSVISSTLAKEEIVKKKEVEYPARIPWCIEISKTGTDSKDLSIQEIQDKVDEVKEEEKERHEADVDASEIDTRVEGLEDARDIPASKVLDQLGIDYKKRQNFECPFHDDSDPSANIHEQDGKERLYCFADSCAENGRAKAFNAIDIMEESGYSFRESLEKFRDEFDVDITIGYNPHDYFTESIHGNTKFNADKLAKDLLQEFNFLKVEGKKDELKIYRNGIWKDQQHAVETIERQVNERLGQETSSRYRTNVKNIVKRDGKIQVQEEDFSHPKGLIPFKNGVYDIQEQEFKEYKPEYHFTFKYEAEYRPELENNDVETFIEEIAPESQDKRKKLHEIAALTIAPWRVKELMPILFGKGSNGKNQYVKMIKKIVGRENYHVTKSKRISNDKFESASIHDAEMLFVDEFGHVSDPADFKRLTDDDQNKRDMHQKSEVVDTSVQPILAANELPNVDDNSDGFYRRWQIINFNQKFTEEEDDNPDKMNPTELEKEYMSKEAIDSYATSLVSHLEDVMESNRLTDQQRRSKVRAVWEEKASAVYRFVDNFLTQADIENTVGNQVGDFIIKKELTKVVNSWLDKKNLSKTDTKHISRVLDNHPDIEANISARPYVSDGLTPDQPSSYEGIRIRDNRIHDIRGVLPLYAWRSPELRRLTNYRKYHDIVNKDKTAIALAFLRQHGESSVDMTELIKELNLGHKELEHINQSDYIVKESVEKQDSFIPFYRIDEEKLEEDIEDADIVYDKHGKSVRPKKWLRDWIDSWSHETRRDKEDIIQKGKSTGFSEEGIISALENLKDNGYIYEPRPEQVKRV